MVKSRRAISRSCHTTAHHDQQPSLHAQEMAMATFPSQEILPPFSLLPDRKPSFCAELGKLTRLSSVLNCSDDQSSENDDADDVRPASSVSDARRCSPSSSSPDPGRLSAMILHPEHASGAALECSIDLKAILASSTSASDAALAFQRWRVSSLKAVFSEELKKVLKDAKNDEARLLALEEEMEKKEKHLVHALADSAQLRAQLCALENVNEQRNDTSDVEVLQLDLVKALERASSSEAEVERYNKEIRKLRERLKAMEDEASRLDSELKSSVSFLQKEKEGMAKENRILLEQLARKDEDVLSQTKEINHLKSVLACLRVSRAELERLKGELQGSAKQQLEYAKPEQKGTEALRHIGFETHLVKDISPETEEASTQSRSVFCQLLDLLQKLTNCLQKNEGTMGPLGVTAPATEELPAATRPGMSGEEAIQLQCEADEGKQADTEAHVASLQKLVTKTPKKGSEGLTTAIASNRKLNNLSMVTCWKWRWVAAACLVQELAKELSTLRSFGKGLVDRAVSFPQPSPTMNTGLESFHSRFLKSGLQSSEEPPAPLTLDKVFTLLTSVCKISSQSAHQEKEVLLKSRKFNHLLYVMARWMQRATQKRQLEQVLVHWLRYLLQSWKDKFKQPTLVITPATPTPKTSPSAMSKVRTASELKGSNSSGRIILKSRGVNKSLSLTKAGSRKEGQEAATDKSLKALQESLHDKLEALEAIIMQEAGSWRQQQVKVGEGSHNQNAGGESSTASPATGLAWKICCELEHCFSEARSQIMTFFGLLNKVPASMHPSGVGIPPRPVGAGQMTEKHENSKSTPQKRRPRIRTSARVFYV